MMWSRLKKSKTFWTAVVGVLGSAVGATVDNVTPDQLQTFQAVVLMVVAAFLRDGVEKNKPKK